MKTLLLIDAHALIHRSFHALPPLTAPDGRPTGALYGLASTLMKTLAADRPDYVAGAFDRPEPTFRKQEYDEYKAHRPKAPDELVAQLVASRDLFETFGIPVFEKPGYEGDDLIGTLARRFASPDLRVEILTGDLDTLQLVTDNIVVRTMKKGVSDTVVYDEAAVRERYGLSPDRLTDYKGLVGDQSDNIPGVRGVGPKTATELLQRFGSLDGIFENASEDDKLAKKVLPFKKEALFSKRLATINCDSPIEPVKLEALAFSGLDTERLSALFSSLGFDSLLRRIEGKTSAPKRPTPTPQPSLLPPSVALVVESSADAQAQAARLSGSEVKVAASWKPIIKDLLEGGVEVSPPLFDCEIAGWLLDPDTSAPGVAELGEKYLHGTDGLSPRELLARLMPVLESELRRERLLGVYETFEAPLIPILASMERWGVALDEERLGGLAREISSATDESARKIYELAGGPFNLNSPAQVSAVLFERLKLTTKKNRKTAGGQRRTGRDILVELTDAHPIVPLILAYREDFKILTSFVLPLRELRAADGRVHTTYLQTSAATGRLASEKPNLQNIPQESRWASALRNAFVSEPGFSLLSFDYSQIELRLLAHTTGDPGLVATFKSGGDIHTATAARVFHVGEREVTKEMRRIGKTLNFGVVYGMGARAFAQASGLPKQDTERFITDYFTSFPTIRRWQEETVATAHKQGYIENANGRRRWFRGMQSGRSGEYDRAAINMPLQSLGADILKLAMIGVVRELASRGWYGTDARLLLSVHDELLFEVRDAKVMTIAPVIARSMESAYRLSVPLSVEARTGETWGALHGLTYPS